MYIRVIDWGEQAVLKAWWCWWGGKGWCDLSGCNSIQCHITAQLNHLRSWVDQVIMPLPVGPESITRWMWPLQTYRVTAMFHFHLFLWIVGTFIWPVFFLYRLHWIWDQNLLFWICTRKQFQIQYCGSSDRAQKYCSSPKTWHKSENRETMFHFVCRAESIQHRTQWKQEIVTAAVFTVTVVLFVSMRWRCQL